MISNNKVMSFVQESFSSLVNYKDKISGLQNNINEERDLLNKDNIQVNNPEDVYNIKN